MIIPPRVAIRESAKLLRRLAKTDPAAAAKFLRERSTADLEDIAKCWQLYARPKQLRPIDVLLLIMICGRGTGKTRAGSEDQLDIAEDWGEHMHGVLVSKSIGDVRDVMIEGPSGLQACARRRGYEVEYIANKSIVRHPSGGVWHVMSAKIEGLGVGFNVNNWWADEVGAWPTGALAKFRAMLLSVRMPSPTPDRKPRGLITMTPRTNDISRFVIRELSKRKGALIVQESSSANAANIDYDELIEYVGGLGSRFARQELDGFLDEGNASFKQDEINYHRRREAPEGLRKVISVDPSIDVKETSDACGIMAIGSDEHRPRPDIFVLGDYTVQGAKWSQWARQTVIAYLVHDCDAIVAEINQGGRGVIEAIETAALEVSEEVGFDVSPKIVPVFATHSKKARAEPVGAVYENGRAHHVGYFAELEKEMTQWVPGASSPNRMDALVQGVAHLLWGERKAPTFGAYYAEAA